MRNLSKTIHVEVFNYEDAGDTERELIERACKVRLNAQAPYSNYWVGCSVLTDNGSFFEGCNVENVNWSETAHAEENAITSAIAKMGPVRILEMAIIGAPANQKVIWPPVYPTTSTRSRIASVNEVCPSCGHCLQIIAENCFDENGKFDPMVYLIGYRAETGEIYRTTIGDAYPMPFLPQHLGVNYAKDPRVKTSK